MKQSPPPLQAANAFYYYADLGRAWAFYRDILGFDTVADYGFAKILRLAGSSFLTLVDADYGMHTVEEPKSVTMALVSDQVEAWYDYLITAGVPIHREYDVKPGRAHDGFVALDPEGYFLEFERFNPHPENDSLLPLLSGIEPLKTSSGTGTSTLSVQATVLWLYYQDLKPMQRFYEDLLGVPLLVDQGWAKVYQVAGGGFIGLVDGERGLHTATDEKSVQLPGNGTVYSGTELNHLLHSLIEYDQYMRSLERLGVDRRTVELLMRRGLAELLTGTAP